jgi:hypothetical protein
VSSGAQPEALRRFSRVALAIDDELSISCRRLPRPDLAGAVSAFARRCAGVDRWVGRVGSAFEAGDDGPTWVDQLSDGEATALVVALGGRFGPRLAFLTSAQRDELRLAFFPLSLRVGAIFPAVSFSSPCASLPRRPDGVDSGLATLAFPDRSRRADLVTGFVDGLVLGAVDERGFDNGGAERARSLGHLLSGFFAVGDVRDLVADVAHGDALAAVLDAAALVPVAGDLLKVGKEGLDAADAVHDTERSLLELGHTLDKHVARSDEQLAEALARKLKPAAAVSSFADQATAERAVAEVLRGQRRGVEAWLAGDTMRYTAEVDLGRPVGRRLAKGAAAPVEVRGVRVTLIRDPSAPLGFFVLTAFPVP